MKKNTILAMLTLLVLAACNSTPNPQGARVRPMNGIPMNQQQGGVGQIPPPPSPGAQIDSGYALTNEGEFIQSQGGNQATAGYPNNGPTFPNRDGSPGYNNDQYNNQNNTGMSHNTGGIQTASGSNIPPAQGGGGYIPQNTNATPPTADIPASGGNAVKTLLEDARKAVSENNLDRAASSLNRAVSLEPRNASIWYDLSQIRLHQGKHAEAEQNARKAISFAGNNRNIIQRSWQIIAAAREARGDRAGAEQAKQQAL